MTREEEVAAAQRRVAETAAAMLSGQMHFLEGVRALRSLLGEAGVAWNDEDALTIDGADSETDSLPIGEVRRHWADEALQRLEPEIEAATQWAKEFASGACESLVARFGK